MAISLPYYVSLSQVDPSYITNVWYEPAVTGQGNFSGANSYRTLNNSGDSFTLIFSYDNFRNPVSGASYLVGGDNWSFGIDQSNFYFVKAGLEAYTFDEITLGQRGCIAITKNENAFSVTNFNIPSQKADSEQTQIFSPQTNLAGTGLFFGTGAEISGVKSFYGTVDQLISFNQILSNSTLNTLFSGFLHQTYINVPGSTVYTLLGTQWQGTGSLSSGQVNLLQSGATYYAQDTFPLPFDGNYYGILNIQGSPYSGYNYINTTPFSVIPCSSPATGSIGTHFLGPQTGLPYSISSDVYFNTNDDEAFFSFDFSQSLPGVTLNLQYKKEDTQSSFLSDNTGYYNNFKMYGIVSEDAYALMQAKFNVPFDQINNLGTFDIVKNLFLASGAIPNDRVFLDGAPETGYVLSGSYLDINNLIETAENKLIYDKVPQTGIILQYFNTKNFATGEFYPKTAVGFSGDQSFAGMYRILEPEYLETHPYHLYYNKEVPQQPTGAIYANLDTHWS